MITLLKQRGGKSARRWSSRQTFLALEELESRTLLDGGLAGLVTNNLKYAADHVLIAFDDTVSPLSRLPAGVSASALPLVNGLYSVSLPSGWNVAQALAAFSTLPGVRYVQPDYELTANVVPNDPNYSTQWDLNPISAPTAWDTGTGSGRTLVAIIDSGVDYNHPDLAANIWTNSGETAGNGIDDDGNGYIDDVHGYDFVNGDGDPMDDNSHGTHVAGTIGAVGNNGIGIAGIDWNVQIMALKFLNASGSGSTSNAILALNYAVNMGAQISNNSWGGGGYNSALNNAIANARTHGHIFVAAAGNNGANNDTTPFYPASYNLDNVVSVAATDSSDNLASFSNYGATVDLAAPGVSIYSTMPGGGYGYKSGTSMAAPHVTGALALVWDIHPSWTYSQVIGAVVGSVDRLASLQDRVGSGGRLNVAAAVNTSADPPAAPSSLADSDVTSSAVTLSWADNSGNETGFAIERLTGGTWSRIATVGVDTTTYQNTGLNPNTAYSYRVLAFNGNGNSAYSNVVDVTTADAVPNAPSSLAASNVTTTSATLTWADNSTNETGFAVERLSAGSWTRIATLGVNVRTYQDSGLTPSTAYSYRVFAFNDLGNSSHSNVVDITTGSPSAPAAPTSLSASVKVKPNLRVNLSWRDNATNETGYRIYRSTDGGATWNMLVQLGANANNYTDYGVSGGQTYLYRVAAYNAVGESQFSNVATASTPGGAQASSSENGRVPIDRSLLDAALILSSELSMRNRLM